jgi:hypothetical protein
MTDPDGPKTDESYGSGSTTLVQGSIPYQKKLISVVSIIFSVCDFS